MLACGPEDVDIVAIRPPPRRRSSSGPYTATSCRWRGPEAPAPWCDSTTMTARRGCSSMTPARTRSTFDISRPRSRGGLVRPPHAICPALRRSSCRSAALRMTSRRCDRHGWPPGVARRARIDEDDRRLVEQLIRRLDAVDARRPEFADLLADLPDPGAWRPRRQEPSPSFAAAPPDRAVRLGDERVGSTAPGPWDDRPRRLSRVGPSIWGRRAAELGRLADVGRLFGLAAIGWGERLDSRPAGCHAIGDTSPGYHDRLGSLLVRLGMVPVAVRAATSAPRLTRLETTAMSRSRPTPVRRALGSDGTTQRGQRRRRDRTRTECLSEHVSQRDRALRLRRRRRAATVRQALRSGAPRA